MTLGVIFLLIVVASGLLALALSGSSRSYALPLLIGSAAFSIAVPQIRSFLVPDDLNVRTLADLLLFVPLLLALLAALC